MRKYIYIAAALALATAAAAATAEDAYIAARNEAIANIKSAASAGKHSPTDSTQIDAIDAQARRRLEQQMRGIVGAVAIKGMEAKGALNLDTLIEGDEGYGLLDGMVFGPVDGKTRVIVTTDSLLRRWLQEHKEWWGKESPLPQQPQDAVRQNAFYTQAVMTDAAISRYAELPIRKPAEADFAFAMLAARSQDQPPPIADEIFVALGRKGRAFIAYSKEFSGLGPIVACDTVRNDLAKKASEAASEAGLSDTQRSEKSERLSAQAEAEFLRCFAAQAKSQKNFAAATAAAQALIERLPAR